MKIEFNKVTWYSKLLALIVVAGFIPALFYYLGVESQKINQTTIDILGNNEVQMSNEILTVDNVNFSDAAPTVVLAPSSNANIINLQCAENKKLSLEYFQVDHSPGPGAIYIPETRTSVSLSREGKPVEYLLNQPSSGNSFSSYVNSDKTVTLEISNYGANLMEKGFVTYRDCVEK